jgi:hypothetical protein
LFDQLVLVHQHLRHVAADLGRQQRRIGGDIGVIRRDVVLPDQQILDDPDDERQDGERAADINQPPPIGDGDFAARHVVFPVNYAP